MFDSEIVEEEFEKLGEKIEILAGGSRPAALAPPLLPKVEITQANGHDLEFNWWIVN